jgi:hypothetical protein
VQRHGGGGGVVAVEYSKPAAWAHDPSGLSKGQVGTGHMAQGGVEHYDVNAVVLEVERSSVALQEARIGWRVEPLRGGQERG